MICMWFSRCQCCPIISCFIKIQNGSIFLVPAYPGCPEKEAIKRACVSGIFSGTTRVSHYQKGKTKTNLDLLEQETVSGRVSAGLYANLHLSPDR